MFDPRSGLGRRAGCLVAAELRWSRCANGSTQDAIAVVEERDRSTWRRMGRMGEIRCEDEMKMRGGGGQMRQA